MKSKEEILKDKGIFPGFRSTYTYDGIISAIEEYASQLTPSPEPPQAVEGQVAGTLRERIEAIPFKTIPENEWDENKTHRSVKVKWVKRGDVLDILDNQPTPHAEDTDTTAAIHES
ncbi:MAG: hypothetical protein V4538_14955 [Bacteroidota bacterium]